MGTSKQKSKGRGNFNDHPGAHEQHVAAGRLGGEKVSRNREHMARIGRKGGQA